MEFKYILIATDLVHIFSQIFVAKCFEHHFLLKDRYHILL